MKVLSYLPHLHNGMDTLKLFDTNLFLYVYIYALFLMSRNHQGFCAFGFTERWLGSWKSFCFPYSNWEAIFSRIKGRVHSKLVKTQIYIVMSIYSNHQHTCSIEFVSHPLTSVPINHTLPPPLPDSRFPKWSCVEIVCHGWNWKWEVLPVFVCVCVSICVCANTLVYGFSIGVVGS
jgi:hypothetical protein